MNRVTLERGTHGDAVRGIADLEAFLDEIAPQHGPNPRLVIDNQDVHRTHSFQICDSGASWKTQQCRV